MSVDQLRYTGLRNGKKKYLVHTLKNNIHSEVHTENVCMEIDDLPK